ncbi:ATP-binding cassette domain-containing protein [Amycolatopsis sp. QT-25]|uniref:ATP-binding cassette domain-containing protein n=1 Tax=Amycolatopsis sp. QT-25 TaxID=3034022 RepID=UPI0023EAFF27|nr:ATP-binding cassette domain-containing protein [Amycolatopsis sp. QT-25]WET76801.1 ATP-binding cassette domain-containing protein [Amycolatopsis sp. QT-25]
MQTAIEVDGLAKRFGSTPALDGVAFAARRGTVLGLLGPNGAGKTTVVRILSTLIRPDAGTAVVEGFDVVADAYRVRRMIGVTGQYAGVDEKLTGLENLVLIGKLLGMSRTEARGRGNALLARFGLGEAGGRMAGGYSGGMRRRLDLAASLVGRPRVLYLDEPTTGLDPASRGELWQVVRELIGEGTTVLLTTQYIEEADRLADDVVVIDKGVVVASGTPEHLKSRLGISTLVIRPRDARRLAAARQVLVSLGHPVTEEDGALVMTAEDDTLLPVVVRRLDERGIPVSELALRRSTLDEVFLTITGAAPAAPDDPVVTR